MHEFLDLCDGLDSCITDTLTLFISGTTPSSVSLLLNQLALSCRMLNVLLSLICSVGGAGVGGGYSWDGVDEQVSQVQSQFDTVLHLRTVQPLRRNPMQKTS